MRDTHNVNRVFFEAGIRIKRQMSCGMLEIERFSILNNISNAAHICYSIVRITLRMASTTELPDI